MKTENRKRKLTPFPFTPILHLGVMGVAGLARSLKEVASKRVCLDEEDEGGERYVIVDGLYALHRASK